MVFAIAAFAIVTCFSVPPMKKPSSMRKPGAALRANFRTRKNYRTYMLASRRTFQYQRSSKRKPVNGSGENEPSTIQSRTPTQSAHARNATIPRPIGARHAAYAALRWAVLSLNECAREPCLAPDRAAILVSRDTTQREAARQVKAVVRRLGSLMGIPTTNPRHRNLAGRGRRGGYACRHMSKKDIIYVIASILIAAGFGLFVYAFSNWVSINKDGPHWYARGSIGLLIAGFVLFAVGAFTDE
jgi:hypothetical protein